MTSQLDLDQGGTSRLWTQQWMGPSIGWIWVPRQNTFPISGPGTYNINLSTSLVTVNSSTGPVTINLPPATNPSFPGAGMTQVGTFADNLITVVDIGGNALSNVITINAAAGENISGSASTQIAFNWGAISLIPVSAQHGWDTVVSNTANPIVYAPPWTGATPYSLQKRLSTLIVPEDFGAAGDGVTDDTTAVNAAINYAMNQAFANKPRAIFLPNTYNTNTGFVVNAPSPGTFGFSLKGVGKDHPTLITSQNIPILTFNCASGSLGGVDVSDLSIVGSSSFTTANHGIVIANNGTNPFNYYSFSNIHIQNCYNAVYFSSATSVGSDWGLISDFLIRNCYRGIYRLCGGTGCVYSTGQIVCSGSPDANGAALTIGTGAAQVGDIVIQGIEMGGTAAGIVLQDNGTYGSNIAVTACQSDAGINPAFNLNGINGIVATAINYGGASGPNVINANCADVKLGEIRRVGISVGSTTLNDVSISIGNGVHEYNVTGGGSTLTLTGLAGGYDSRLFEIFNVSSIANNVILRNENAGSLAQNRFHLGADVTLTPGQSIILSYLGSSTNNPGIQSRWIRRGGQ